MEATLVIVVVVVVAAATVWFCTTYVALREQKQMAFIQGAIAGVAVCMLLGVGKHESGRPNHFADVFSAFMENVPGVRKMARTRPSPDQ